ncbi:hypothetical protein Aduo_015566 [Ancylostoma duodenale]
MAALHFLVPSFLLLSAATAQPPPPAIGGEIQKLPDCKQLGANALRKNIRERLFTEVVVATGQEMRYDCSLEGFASLFLTNRSLYQVYTANVNIVQSEFDGTKTKEYKVRDFIREAVKSWAALYGEMGPRSLFGCNYKLDGNKYKVVCLYM